MKIALWTRAFPLRSAPKKVGGKEKVAFTGNLCHFLHRKMHRFGATARLHRGGAFFMSEKKKKEKEGWHPKTPAQYEVRSVCVKSGETNSGNPLKGASSNSLHDAGEKVQSPTEGQRQIVSTSRGVSPSQEKRNQILELNFRDSLHKAEVEQRLALQRQNATFVRRAFACSLFVTEVDPIL
jgi:hypothetical protein